MSKVLLMSFYELGAQPLGCAVPAAMLDAAGHQVRQRDLSIEVWPEADLAWADALICSVPMHTALRLGLQALGRVREQHPHLPVAFHGLYAPVAATTGLLGPDDLATAGEVDNALLSWLDTTARGEHRGGVVVELTRAVTRAKASASLPRRADLPDLEQYAHLVRGGEQLLVGTVESSIGCNHRCRHCPVPVIFNGRSRAIASELVLGDIDQLVQAGARHIHFSDADFLNRPRHALEIARQLHERHPALSFDATIKVSHILRYESLFEELASAGLSFVISAVESTSDTVLAALDKGHSAKDAATAVQILRASGIELRPSLLPFTPWTTREDLLDLLDFVAANDLVWNLDAVQYGIRLLLPPGSLLLSLDDEELRAALRGYDPDALGYRWAAKDTLLDDLARELGALTEALAESDATPEEGYEKVRALVYQRLELSDPGAPAALSKGIAGPLRPHLSESWFCCAEPTKSQYDALGESSCDAC